MNKITAPLKSGDQGPEVENLKNALLALLERAAIYPDDESTRQSLIDALRSTQPFVWLAVHTNHPRELTDAFDAGAARFRAAQSAIKDLT
mgnify:CR=1 FL=1